jgi:hypothetical protein
MELNKNKKQVKEAIRNPEDSIVNQRRPEIQLYLEASSLKLKSDSFYQTADDKLTSFLDLAKSVDKDYVFGLANFLSDNGIKLSPVILLSVLSHNGFSFRDKDVTHIFNTPQRIAEAIALDKIIKLNNSFKQHALRVALQNMSHFTLRKNKMTQRKIKLKDLIKLLRPKPDNDTTSKLYKAIIENSSFAKMKETETFVRVKSSKKLSEKEKCEYLVANVEKVPINELIRNLRFITEHYNFDDDVKLQKKVLERLKTVDFRFLNIFDLIETAIHVPQLEKMLFEIVKDFVEKVKIKFNYVEEDVTVLFDASGSMEDQGQKNGFKYLVIFSILFNDVQLRFFGNALWEEARSKNIIPLIKQGRLQEAYARFNCPDGTALLDSIKELITEKPLIKNLIIISDEVSWIEGEDLRTDINDIAKLLKDKRVILINPVVYKGTVFKDNLLAIASLTSSILYNVMLQTNPDAFIKEIKYYTGGKK